MLKQHKDHYEAYKRALLESSFAFDQFFSGLQKWQVWLSVTFSPFFTLNWKREKFIMSPCFTGDKKELALKRFNATFKGRCFQVCLGLIGTRSRQNITPDHCQRK